MRPTHRPADAPALIMSVGYIANTDPAIFSATRYFRIERERIDEVVEQHLDPLNQAVPEFLAELGA